MGHGSRAKSPVVEIAKGCITALCFMMFFIDIMVVGAEPGFLHVLGVHYV